VAISHTMSVEWRFNGEFITRYDEQMPSYSTKILRTEHIGDHSIIKAQDGMLWDCDSDSTCKGIDYPVGHWFTTEKRVIYQKGDIVWSYETSLRKGRFVTQGNLFDYKVKKFLRDLNEVVA
jgi:hypothetical protein